MDPHRPKQNPHFDAITIGGILLGVVLTIGYLWFIKWLVDTYLFAVLLIFAGITPLLMLYCAVGFVVSIATIIAGKD